MSVTPDPYLTWQTCVVQRNVSVNSPGSGTPTGTVTITGGSGCSAPVGDGQCTVTSSTAGAITLTASYGGDSNFNSSSGTASHQVNANVTPSTATVTTPADGSMYRAATVPASFSGSAADGTGGSGLNANSTTFTLQRSADNFYWTGTAWQAGVFNLATTHSATTSNTAAAWTSSATLPTWASESDGVYTVKATVTDKVGNTFTGSAVSFTLDKTAPNTSSVTAPANGSSYGAAAVPASFGGSAADNNGGVGLNANSTTFTLQRNSDSFYWTGSAWQAGAFNLATTHSATTSNTAAAWTSSATLPTWASESDGGYTVQATATDKVGNTFTGSAVSFTLEKTPPITASVTAPASGGLYRAATVPASFSGTAADDNGGLGLNANSTTRSW